LTRREAERAVAEALDLHQLRYTVHCRERMIQRRISAMAVRRALRRGALSHPRWDEAYADWVVVCTGPAGQDGRLRVRLAVSGRAVWIVTVYVAG
jgi:hypothetical protein